MMMVSFDFHFLFVVVMSEMQLLLYLLAEAGHGDALHSLPVADVNEQSRRLKLATAIVIARTQKQLGSAISFVLDENCSK